MKKFFLGFAFLSLISVTAFSQIKFGVQAGSVLASQKAKMEGLKISSDSKVAFTVGFLAEIPVADAISFQPSLNFTQKGSKFNSTQFGFETETTQTLNYVELPLNVLYNAKAGNGKFFGGLGPVLSYGISGKYKMKASGEEETEDIEFGTNKDEDDYKPFEFGGNVLAGYEFSNGLFVAANYNAGLSNILTDDSENSSVKNSYFGVRVGFKFGGAKK